MRLQETKDYYYQIIYKNYSQHYQIIHNRKQRLILSFIRNSGCYQNIQANTPTVYNTNGEYISIISEYYQVLVSEQLFHFKLRGYQPHVLTVIRVFIKTMVNPDRYPYQQTSEKQRTHFSVKLAFLSDNSFETNLNIVR